MKAILEFDMSQPEDRGEHKRACSATSMYVAVLGFSDYLRNKLKYGDLPDEVYKALVDARSQLFEELNSRNLSLEDLE